MSESDKTRQKLVDSMRKTKSGSADKEQVSTAAEKTAPEKSQPATSGSKTKTARPVRKTTKTKQEDSVNVDAYQSRQRRVWPD